MDDVIHFEVFGTCTLWAVSHAMIEGILIMKEYSVLGNEANENNIVCYYLRYRGRDSPSFERSGPDDA